MIANLEYKGYQGTIEADLATGLLYGKLAFIRDLVTYEAETLPELNKEFCFSVDEYLSDCEELNKTPDKLFKGSFNVRTGPDLHRQAVIAAQGESLNSFVCEAIKEKIAHQ
jgi:predicted HicB family RNase H-like nuclease